MAMARLWLVMMTRVVAGKRRENENVMVAKGKDRQHQKAVGCRIRQVRNHMQLDVAKREVVASLAPQELATQHQDRQKGAEYPNWHNEGELPVGHVRHTTKVRSCWLEEHHDIHSMGVEEKDRYFLHNLLLLLLLRVVALAVVVGLVRDDMDDEDEDDGMNGEDDEETAEEKDMQEQHLENESWGERRPPGEAAQLNSGAEKEAFLPTSVCELLLNKKMLEQALDTLLVLQGSNHLLAHKEEDNHKGA